MIGIKTNHNMRNKIFKHVQQTGALVEEDIITNQNF